MAKLLYSSSKGVVNPVLLTIFTPTYNRIKTLKRTFESILQLKKEVSYRGKPINFEWIIIDDGSTDDTRSVVEQWCNKSSFPIFYYWQENQGKHVAMNFATSIAKGEFFLTLDSDDSLLPNALEVFFKAWESIKDIDNYCCVSARCIDENHHIVGDRLPLSPMDVSFTKLRMVYRNDGELLDMYRTSVLCKYHFPQYDSRMRFCPESIVWHEMAKKYLMRVLDVPVRIYYYDADTSLIKSHNISRSVSTYYLWLYMINNLSQYIFSNPKEILKAYVGISMDGYRVGYSFMKMWNDIHSLPQKISFLMLLPLGLILSKIK